MTHTFFKYFVDLSRFQHNVADTYIYKNRVSTVHYTNYKKYLHSTHTLNWVGVLGGGVYFWKFLENFRGCLIFEFYCICAYVTIYKISPISVVSRGRTQPPTLEPRGSIPPFPLPKKLCMYSKQCKGEQSRKIQFDLHHQVIIQD